MPSQGPLNFSVFTNDAAVGTLPWANPGNAAASDNTRATASSAEGLAVQTNYLKATGAAFDIPADATIDGIFVEVERIATGIGGSVVDAAVRIVKGGVIGNTNPDFDVWGTSEGYTGKYGDNGDYLWGEAWTPEDINSADFGFAISATVTSALGTKSAQIDHIRVTVFYTEDESSQSSSSSVSSSSTSSSQSDGVKDDPRGLTIEIPS